MRYIDEGSMVLKSCEIFQLNSNLTRFHLGNSLLLGFCLLGGNLWGFSWFFGPVCIAIAFSYFSELVEEMPFTVTGEKWALFGCKSSDLYWIYIFRWEVLCLFSSVLHRRSLGCFSPRCTRSPSFIVFNKFSYSRLCTFSTCCVTKSKFYVCITVETEF